MFRTMGKYCLAILIGIAIGEQGATNITSTIAENGPGIVSSTVIEPLKTLWGNSGDFGIFE